MALSPYLLAQVMIVHRLEDLVPLPSSVLLLGQGGDGTEHRFSAALDHVLGESVGGWTWTWLQVLVLGHRWRRK